MRRLLAILAAMLLALALAGSAHAGHARDQSTMQNLGDSSDGSSWDYGFGGPNHYMYASWDRGNRLSVTAGQAVWSEITLRIDANNLPDTTPLGHKTCVQVAVDWRVPQGENHYDARLLRNCDPNSSVTWTFSEKATQNIPPDCYNGGLQIPCDAPMGRVQFARYDSDASTVVGPIDCRAMAGVAFADCTSWEPWGAWNVTRMRIKFPDGHVETTGSLDATYPNG